MSSSFSNWQSFEDEEDEDEEETLEKQDTGAQKDNVIFAVDCTRPMHEPDENGVSHFQGALICAAKFLQNKIIQAESDRLGIVFFGTEESQNEQGFEHIYVQYDLDTPDVDRILELEKIQKGGAKSLGSNDDYSLAEVFWTCSNMFSAKGDKNSIKRIFLITSNDDPHRGNSVLQRNARVRAQDLQDIGITITLFPVERDEKHPFNYEAFYQDLPGISGNEEDEYAAPVAASRGYEELQKKIRRREVKKRTAYRIPFHLSEGVSIGIKGYNLVMEAKKGNYTYLERKTNVEARTETSWQCSATQEFLLPADMKSSWVYGGEHIVFTKDEVATIKYMFEPGLVLLGFKDRAALKDKYNIRPATFIQPDEGEYTGSSSVFAHLLHRLAARNKIAIGRLTARRNTGPRIVALLPEVGYIKRNGDEVPSGFHVIYMPFNDDIRHVPRSNARVETENRKLVVPILERLKIGNFKTSDYENPVLQKHYANLQALALMKDYAEEIDDKTLPKTEVIHQRVGADMETLKMILLQDLPDMPATTTKKRSAPASRAADGAAPKRARGDADLSEATFRAKAQEGKLTSYTVAQLTEFLQSRDVKPAKKKADLIAQIEQSLGV
ncbi:SPOC like C-terminal domain-containing protein [Fimicolochytrium jonesii]|uniref:SPOC like C-terminal domain-containing protein n=1 Tax=Fimicolochytrium jonesii TaxID=1396493 RepID=UPI0022FE6D16|nr:SPOC like C-terminal domain-containing protein [Fimicolochytrium jonesii]KAI8825632.1 SPOC like C-terminal domain-containing protein [Fimicolochytrium jonesii]